MLPSSSACRIGWKQLHAQSAYGSQQEHRYTQSCRESDPLCKWIGYCSMAKRSRHPAGVSGLLLPTIITLNFANFSFHDQRTCSANIFWNIAGSSRGSFATSVGGDAPSSFAPLPSRSTCLTCSPKGNPHARAADAAFRSLSDPPSAKHASGHFVLMVHLLTPTLPATLWHIDSE